MGRPGAELAATEQSAAIAPGIPDERVSHLVMSSRSPRRRAQPLSASARAGPARAPRRTTVRESPSPLCGAVQKSLSTSQPVRDECLLANLYFPGRARRHRRCGSGAPQIAPDRRLASWPSIVWGVVCSPSPHPPPNPGGRRRRSSPHDRNAGRRPRTASRTRFPERTRVVPTLPPRPDHRSGAIPAPSRTNDLNSPTIACSPTRAPLTR